MFEVGLARCGKIDFLPSAIEHIRSDNSLFHNYAVAAMHACLPFDGPAFQDNRSSFPEKRRQKIHDAWNQIRDIVLENRLADGLVNIANKHSRLDLVCR